MDQQAQKKLQQFLDQYKSIKAKKGEVLMRPGEQNGLMIFVKKGILRRYVISKLGSELTIAAIQPSFPFAFTQYLTGTINHHYIETFSAVEYVKVPKKEFEDFITQNPDVFVEMSKRLAHRIEELYTNIEYYLTGDAYMKVASIIYLIGERNGKTNEGAIEIESMPTHKDISELIGLTRETVSLQILKLEKDGVIKRKGRKLIIPSRQKIEEVSAYVPV